MENDIKILEELLNYDFNQLSKEEYQAIEHLIARNKELEYKLREHICIEAHEQVKQLYIPKSKVKEKIEEVIQNSSKFNCLIPLNYNDEYNATRYAVTKLAELLQEGDK